MFRWTASVDALWLSLIPAEGLAPGGSGMKVEVNSEGLPPGDYTATILISSPTVAQPVHVPVFLTSSVTGETFPVSSKVIAVPESGAVTATTFGSSALAAGYAVVEVDPETAPHVNAVVSISQGGVIVSEVGVPASPPMAAARVFVDFHPKSAGGSTQPDSLGVDVNTGVAIVNPEDMPADVVFTLRNSSGKIVGMGRGVVGAGVHSAKFINYLSDLASDFSLPSEFAVNGGIGSLEIQSDRALSILALRMTMNQRGEIVLTSTPSADLERPLSVTPLYFPQFVDGGGYTTSIALLNTTQSPESGRLEVFDDAGEALIVGQAGGPEASSFAYWIPAEGTYLFTTTGKMETIRVGSVQVISDEGTLAPTGAGIFRLTRNGVVETESGIPSATPTTHARIYVDVSQGHDTGLAIAAPDNLEVSISLLPFHRDGSLLQGDYSELRIPGFGHNASFVRELIPGLPDGFTGVLAITSPKPFVALTLRSLSNQRGDFLLTTFPTADLSQPAPVPIVFPQIADGGGYLSQIIFIGTKGAATALLDFRGDSGAPLFIGR